MIDDGKITPKLATPVLEHKKLADDSKRDIVDVHIPDETLNNQQSADEDAIKDTEKRLENSENGTPKIDSSKQDNVQYFQSRDPAPK